MFHFVCRGFMPINNLAPSLNSFKNLLKFAGGLLMKTAVVMSASRGRITSEPQINILDCHGNYSQAFAEDAMQAFINAMPHVCNESLPLLDEFEPSPLLKNITLIKFSSATVSTLDFATGSRKDNEFQARANNGEEFKIVSPEGEKLFTAQIHGYQEDELCGKFMNLKCS